MTKTSPSKLADALADLLTRVEAGETAPHTALARGLRVAARLTPQGRQLVLARDGGEPSQLEAATCARHAGWADYMVAELVSPRGARCLTVTEGQALAATTHPEGTCGRCDHGTPDGYGLIECALGWPHHDGFWSERGKVLVAMGHGDATLPACSAGHPCSARLVGGHLGYAARVGWAGA